MYLVVRNPYPVFFLDEVLEYDCTDMVLLVGLDHYLLFVWIRWFLGSTWLGEGGHLACGSVLGPELLKSSRGDVVDLGDLGITHPPLLLASDHPTNP